jgi:hypothetical protein
MPVSLALASIKGGEEPLASKGTTPLLSPNRTYEWTHVRSTYFVDVPEISVLMLLLMPLGNATEQSSLPKVGNLHAEFRTILKLTELVLAINSGHLILHLPRNAYTPTPLLDVMSPQIFYLFKAHHSLDHAFKAKPVP